MTLHLAPFKSPQPSLTRDITRPSREVSEDRPDNLLWLDKNENCDPAYTSFIYQLLREFPPKAIYGYPDCYVLYKKLADQLNVEINELFIAAGSDGIIRSAYETFVQPGDTVIYTEPTFAMYAIYAEMFGAKSHVLHYESTDSGPQLSANKIIDAIKTVHPKLIGLPNPNSPTGTVFTQVALKQLCEAAADVGAVLLIDEAYYPFHGETLIGEINNYPNLLIARTFSKAWGAAGLRIGVGVAQHELIRECHKMRPMYEAGNLSIVLAERLLDFESEMLASVARLNAGKKYFLTEMETLGLRTFHAAGNFLHVDFGECSQAIHASLADMVLYRQYFTHPSLSGFSRFTATTHELFVPIVDTIARIVKGQFA